MFEVKKDDLINCSDHPTEFRPNQDITGIGISLAWTITAVLALCLVVANYFVAYRPDVDPFGSQDQDQAQEQDARPRVKLSFRPNPIDQQVLGWRLRRLQPVDQASDVTQVQSDAPTRKDRVRIALIQCMLTMSDFQLITGLSVLISGYSQLQSGISTMHWERIIDLAWFSSITHLCCLTFLRDHLLKNPRAQFWRLPGMIVLVILLTVALIPSAHYVEAHITFAIQPPDQSLYYNSTLDYAKCFFERNNEGLRRYYYEVQGNRIDIKKQNSVISAIILIFGMTNRLWRLYETSTNVYLSARQWISRHTQAILRWIFKKTMTRSAILMGLTYRPILATYLLFCLILDILLSKAFEVWWLIIGLLWGLTGIFPISGSTDQEWTFGQVIALLMLVAPVIALAETLITAMYQSESSKDAVSQESTCAQRPHQNPVLPPTLQPIGASASKDDPGYDFYGRSPSFDAVVYLIMAEIAAISLYMIVARGVGGDNTGWEPLDLMWALSVTPNLLHLVYSMAFILCSLSIDRYTPKSRFSRISVGVLSFAFYSVSVVAGFGFLFYDGYIYLSLPFGAYLVSFVIEQVLARRHSAKTALSPGGQTIEGRVSPTSSTPHPRPNLSPTASVIGPSDHRSQVDTSLSLIPPQRQDTEADVGVVAPRRRWTSDM